MNIVPHAVSQLISEELGFSLEKVDVSHLGTAKKVSKCASGCGSTPFSNFLQVFPIDVIADRCLVSDGCCSLTCR